jgi:hypothetical protein
MHWSQSAPVLGLIVILTNFKLLIIVCSIEERLQRYKFLLIFHEILAKFKLSFYLCAINIYVMEEKRYPNIEEESNIHMACEPAPAVASVASSSVDGVTAVHDWIDDLDWNKYPIVGPASEAEAIERIEKAEEDMKDPSKWVTSEEVDKYLFEKFPWLR